MNTNERISVLIPTYNCGKYIAECIESALAQVVSAEMEIIIVDDGSTDDTREVCSRYPCVKYIYQHNQGVAVARNHLLQEATGDYVAFLDADDIWIAGKLEAQIAYLREHPECAYVGCDIQDFQENIPSPPYKKTGNAVHYLIPSMIRRTAILQTGWFDETLRVGEDTDYIIRMRNKNVGLPHVIPEVYLLRRIRGASNLTQKNPNMARDLAALLRKGIREKKRGDV